MAKKVKVAILRARHDNSPKITDAACISMLMTNATNHSLFNYWSFNTYNYLDFVGSALFPWVDITLSSNDLSRGTQVAKAYAATKAIPNNNVDDFDIYFVITYPGQITIANPMAGQPNQPANLVLNLDSGAGPVINDKKACAIPVITSDFTFMCHEMGHILGFKHTYGLLNNGMDWDLKPPYDEGPICGDPYDIMSSASFGTRTLDPAKPMYTARPIFAGPSHPDWPVKPTIKMGPAPARAQIHHWDPAAIPANKMVDMQTPAGNKRSVRLYAASSKKSPHLVIVHAINEDAEGRNRCYIEYRDNKGWDKGLDVSGNDLARRAVVVHTLADGNNDGVRCWYRGQIKVPVELDSDLKVTGTPLVVRVVDTNVDEEYVEVEISTVHQRGVDINIQRRDEEITMIDAHEMGTPCGDTIIYGTHILQSIYIYKPVSYGYGGEGSPTQQPPTIKWKVNGIIVSGDGYLSIAASAYPVNYIVHPVTMELTLISNPADRYTLQVEATATEPDGSNPTTATTLFDPPGWYNGFSAADQAKLAKCLGKYLRYVKVRPGDLIIPPGPDPYRINPADRITKARLLELVNNIKESKPAAAIGLHALTVIRYGL